jgi:hypothetical protein
MSDVVAVALITVTGSTLVTIVALIVAARQARTARTLDLKKQKRHFDATRQKDDLTELRQLCDEALKTMNSVETMNPVEETPAGGASAGLSEGPNQLAQLRGHASKLRLRLGSKHKVVETCELFAAVLDRAADRRALSKDELAALRMARNEFADAGCNYQLEARERLYDDDPGGRGCGSGCGWRPGGEGASG